MCIAIVQTPGSFIPNEYLHECHANNRDGAGYAYVDKDTKKVIIRKGYFKAGEFIEAYRRTLEEGHGEHNAMLLHFRIATMGSVNRDNCHPFALEQGAMIHNGCLFFGVDKSGRDRSDTRILAEGLSKSFTYDRLRNNKEIIESIASSNKLAFLFDGGNYVIVNEDLGIWEDDVWYSNRSFKPYTRGGWGVRHYGYGTGGDCEYPGAIQDWE